MTTLMPETEAPQDQGEPAWWAEFVRTRAADLREKLFDLHYSHARMLAAKIYARRYLDDVEFAEYLQLACVGLLEAIDKFQPDQGSAFRTFASFRIEGSILNGLERMTEQREQLSLQRRARQERIASLKIGLKGDVTKQEALELLCEIATGLAVGLMLEDTGMFLDDEGASQEPSAYQTMAWSETCASLRAAVRELSVRERKIISYHYVQNMSFEQIGGLLELTKGRVSQIHRQALMAIRDRLGGPETMRLII